MTNQSPAEALRQQLIDHIHRPVAWAKVGKQDDIYLMDVEKTDHLAEDMANYAMQIVTAYAATVEREAEDKLAKALDNLVEKHYQLRLEHNHYDMKWYAYYAGRAERKLHDDDNDWKTASDTPLEAVDRLAALQGPQNGDSN